jgi:hypothetical protein
MVAGSLFLCFEPNSTGTIRLTVLEVQLKSIFSVAYISAISRFFRFRTIRSSGMPFWTFQGTTKNWKNGRLLTRLDVYAAAAACRKSIDSDKKVRLT